MQCPNCHHDMKLSDYENVRINVCPACRGVWLDHKELQTIAERHIEKIDPAVLKNYAHAPGLDAVPGIDEDRKRQLLCPVCKETLELINYGYSSGIVLDHCPADCGVYLDDRELEAAQAWAEQGEEKAAEMDKYYATLAKASGKWADVSVARGAKTLGSLIFGFPSHLAGLIRWIGRERQHD